MEENTVRLNLNGLYKIGACNESIIKSNMTRVSFGKIFDYFYILIGKNKNYGFRNNRC